MTDRLEQLTELARTTADWVPASEELARRVEDLVAGRGGSPTLSQALQVPGMGPGLSSGVRSAGSLLAPTMDVIQVFAEGEIAFVAEEGEALGAWIVRGTVWLHSTEQAATLDWLEEDHVIASVPIRSGEAFEIEEFAGTSWHLELRLARGLAYRFGAMTS